MRPTLGIIGAGKVGATLARLWFRAGYPIVTIYSRQRQQAESLAVQVGARAVASPADTDAQLVLLTVPDDAIESVASQLAMADADLSGRAYIHTSGAHDAAVLAALRARGAMTGSLHPIFPFAAVEAAVEGLPGSAFALEAEDERLRGWLLALIEALHGQPLLIPPGKKALYHAALVIASNYTVTLYALAQQILIDLGGDSATANAALTPLVQATVANIAAQGIPDALTGPLVRGDAGTVEAHLAALATYDARVAALYRLLTYHTLPLAAQRGATVDAIAQGLNL